MAERMNRDELDLLLGAYALDAVDERERAQVEDLLADDPSAADEVDDFKEMVGWLVEPTGEPPELWSGIRASLDPPPQDAKVARRRIRPVGRGIGRALAVAALIAAAVTVGAVTISTDRNVNVAELASDARDDGARTARLTSPNGTRTAEVVYAEDGRGFVLPRSLPELPRGRTYQLWALVGDEVAPRPISAGVLGRSFDATMFEFQGPVVGFAISVEDAPGATAPSEDRLVGRFA